MTKLIENILIGSDFDGFSFNEFFTLYFHNSKQSKSIEIMISSDWYIDEKKDWDRKIALIIEQGKYVQPDELLVAFELANLRWSVGSRIEEIQITENSFIIIFESEKMITIQNEADMDWAWSIQPHIHSVIEPEWTIICEDNTIYVENEKII